MDGVTTIVKVAHVRLCNSRMMVVRAYPRGNPPRGGVRRPRAGGFAFFKSACGHDVYDNMKTAAETIFLGKDRQYNRRFLQMCSHHLVEPVACTPASGWEKEPGREPGRPRPRTLLHAAAAIQELRRTQRLASRQMPFLGESACPSRAARPDDLGSLRGGATRKLIPYRGFTFRWVPRAAGLGVEDLSGTVRQQQILGHERRQPARRHPRLRRSDRCPPGWTHGGRAPAVCYGRGKTIYDPWHYVPVLARKPGALRNGAPFKDWVLPKRRSIGCSASS